MRISALSAAIILAISSVAASAASDLSVELPSSIESREGWFYLGEYAEIKGDRELADAASMAVIRHSGSFSRGDVIEALGQTEVAGRSVAMDMPDVVRVSPEPDIASELRAMTGWKWRIDVDVVPEGWAKLMEGYSGFHLPPKIIPGARSLAIKLDDGGGLRTKQVKLTWYQPMAYSAVPIAKDAQIGVSSLRMRIGRAGMMMTNFWSPEQLANAVARKPVNAWTPIETGDVTQKSFVRAGSTVTMVASVNGLGVEVKGIAMQRGGMGDVIKVKNLSSKKVLMARIVGDGRVEIDQR
ncbi:MAG: flagellar basal body P-ring formation chaperone FlgA [Synergistaceae bacterium]|jgi:flagella basal body P-ring formation protein FlgA|nr:flagellar basal body P-ring formation chaperone FlgA [Synergistaceae bacterium]